MIATQIRIRLGVVNNAESLRARLATCTDKPGFRRSVALAVDLINEQAQLFAPLYVWRSNEAVRRFLLGRCFAGLADTLERPRVHTWHVLEFGFGADAEAPTFATREIDALACGEGLSRIARRERELHRRALSTPGLYAHSTFIDLDRWEVARFSLWRDEASAAPGEADCVQPYRAALVAPLTPARASV